ncbi:MAG: tetratricopeptide repeat protein, partial [Duncaniella sp.]|nr:tetratricopeptide repeat protein [Duncaniella sp.]
FNNDSSVASPDASASSATDPGVTETASSGSSLTQEQVKARFSSLATIADNTSPEQIYNNKDIRGRVQDRNVSIEMEPIFNITYYTSPTELKQSGDYMREVDDINATRILRFLLQVSNHEPQMTDESVAQTHFSSIGYYNSYLASHTPRAIDYLGRAMDFMTLRNYESAIADLSRAIALTPDFTLAYLLRANARYLSRNSQDDTADNRALHLSPHEKVHQAIADLDSVIALSPASPIAHFNKGVMLAQEGDNTSALQAFTRAIELRPDFGEAYFNRGYVYLSLGNRDAAFADLARAGQLGIVPSYNLLKRMSKD